MKNTFIIAVAALVFLAPAAHAAVVTETVEYRHGDAVLEGFLAYDDAAGEAKRPGVIVVHEWKGPGPYVEERAKQLAALGYVAFAVDMYGKGVRPESHEEAGKLAGIYKNDRNLMRARVNAGLDVLKEHPFVDASKIAAIGYCFGGTTVLELARGGADVKLVASFHGSLGTPSPAAAGNVKAKVLIFHGADDKFVPGEEVAALEKEMKDANVDYVLESYPGAVHSFTVKSAGNDPSKGMAYDAEADRKSWQALEAALADAFAKK